MLDLFSSMNLQKQKVNKLIKVLPISEWIDFFLKNFKHNILIKLSSSNHQCETSKWVSRKDSSTLMYMWPLAIVGLLRNWLVSIIVSIKFQNHTGPIHPQPYGTFKNCVQVLVGHFHQHLGPQSEVHSLICLCIFETTGFRQMMTSGWGCDTQCGNVTVVVERNETVTTIH